MCACVVANAAFFQAVYLDFKGSGKHGAVATASNSALDDRRPSRRPDQDDDEEIIGIWKRTSFGVDGREYEGRETPSSARSGIFTEQRLTT